MSKITYALIAAIAIFASFPRAAGAGQTGTAVKVLEIGFYRDGSLYGKFSGKVCDDPDIDQTIGQVQTTDPKVTLDGIRGLLSILQSAKLTGTTLVVYTDGVTQWGCRIWGVNLNSR